MSEEERDGHLFNVLYDYLRWPQTLQAGALDELHKRQRRGRSNQLIDDALTAIAWALAHPALDFRTVCPFVPDDRPKLVAYLEIAQRDLREVRKLPPPP